MSVMEPKYCPTCGDALGTQYFDGRERAYCGTCDKHIFHLPSVCGRVAIVCDSGILLIHRTGPPHGDTWTIPGGLVEWDEQPRKAAARELVEESGVKANAEALTLINATRLEGPHGNVSSIGLNYAVPYAATSGEPSPGEEVQDAQFWTLDRIDQSDEKLRPGERTKIQQALQWEAENR